LQQSTTGSFFAVGAFSHVVNSVMTDAQGRGKGNALAKKQDKGENER
jgi:hypothetical protein